MINVWNNEELSLEYFIIDPLTKVLSDDLPKEEYETAAKEKLDQMIADENNPIVGIDSTEGYWILDNVSINQFQSLLNNAASQEVTRIK